MRATAAARLALLALLRRPAAHGFVGPSPASPAPGAVGRRRRGLRPLSTAPAAPARAAARTALSPSATDLATNVATRDAANGVRDDDDDDDEDAAAAPAAELLAVRRTAALVLSLAVRRVLPGSAPSGGPSLVADGFHCDVALPDDAGGAAGGGDLRARIKAEMDALIAAAAPVTVEVVSREEARRRLGDGAAPRHEDEEGRDGATVRVGRVGEEWVDVVDASWDGGVLADAGLLHPGALAVTSICRGERSEEEEAPSSSPPRHRQRIAATAWESPAALAAFKTRVTRAQDTVLSFGNLVDWGAGSLDELECWCCAPPQAEGAGLGNVGSLGAPGAGAEMVGPRRTTGARLTTASGPRIDARDRPSARLAAPFVPAKDPDWLREREAIFDAVRADRDAELASKPAVPIAVTLPDGTVMGADFNLTSWRSTPLDVARAISDGLANVAVVARVRHTRRAGGSDAVVAGGDGLDHGTGEEEEEVEEGEERAELWDLTRPLEGDAVVEILKFDDDAARTVFWHSSAHLLGQSLEHNYGALLTVGPPVAGGFYYDAYLGDTGLSETQFGDIEDEFRKSVKRKEAFERLVVTRDEALALFKYSPFKTALIEAKVPAGTRTTVYRNGDLIDLCMGPHVPHTGKIKAFKMLRCSAAQWLGDADGDRLQRVYGVSFPSKKLLKAHVANLEAARERDHRRLGVQQKLFMFHALSPGSAFFLPHGTVIYNALCEFIREQYRAREYQEVITPNVFNLKLWEQSGHAQHYKDDMFTFDVENEEWGMKPMNCPAHCLMFGSTTRSYRELPLRIADFGVLHRNEASGALTGLTRVRRFQQDDAHIFCAEGQIEEEVLGCLEFMKYVYDTFGMSYKLELSTRPAKALGEQGLWDQAEAALAAAMDQFAGPGNWKVNPGDGAFYGPKIDIKVMDAMDRIHQCATIQLDFQLPLRFDLRYKTPGKGGDGKGAGGDGKGAGGDGKEDAIDVTPGADPSAADPSAADPAVPSALPPGFARPVMVHRAMLGSVERMFAVLLEHYGGKWPFWLSPRQALVVPVGMAFVPYAREVRARLRAAGFHAEVDDSTNSLKKKVREGQLAQYNYILVVGETEETNDSVAVRNRLNEQEGEKKVEEVLAEFAELRAAHK